MVKVFEFKNVQEINEFLSDKRLLHQFDVIPVPRSFEHPVSRLMVNSISYVLIEND
jgi:hypothetical protein